MAGITVPDAVDILRQAPRLASCSFTLEEIDGSSGVKLPTASIVNSALKKLDIHCYNTAIISMFANSVTLPSLWDFSLRTSVIPDLKSLVESHIQKFTLVLVRYVPDDDIIKLLNILSCVEEIILEAPLLHG
jgi:hypothetical protein